MRKSYSSLVMLLLLSHFGLAQDFIVIKHAGMSDGVLPVVVLSDSTLTIDEEFKKTHLKVYNERYTPRDIYIRHFKLEISELELIRALSDSLMVHLSDSIMSKDRFGPIDIIGYTNGELSTSTLYNKKSVKIYLECIESKMQELNLSSDAVESINDLIFRLFRQKYVEKTD